MHLFSTVVGTYDTSAYHGCPAVFFHECPISVYGHESGKVTTISQRVRKPDMGLINRTMAFRNLLLHVQNNNLLSV